VQAVRFGDVEEPQKDPQKEPQKEQQRVSNGREALQLQ
jgi:hypothetical protein